MQYIISIILCIIFSIIITIIIYNNKKKNNLFKQEIEQKYNEQYKLDIQTAKAQKMAEIDAEVVAARQRLYEHKQLCENAIDDARTATDNMCNELQERVNVIDQLLLAKQEEYDRFLETQKQSVDAVAAEYKIAQLEKLDNEIKLLYNKEEEKVKATIAELQQKLYNEMGVKQELLKQLTDELDTLKATRDSLNEDILRRKELEEHEEYYRVVVSEFAKADINLLMDVRDKLHIRESLDKLIYETYVSKAVTEMTRRVLNGEAPSGIYKITRLKTGEIYIGKSTDVKKRWTEHCKTAFGVGSIAHSILHTTMKKDGIDNFTFELLEKVPKDKLTEREKYWIAFYDTKKYGMNERNG